MRATRRFDPAAFVAWLEEEGVPYLLIGGQAVRMYGSTRVTYDFDFWVDPRQRQRVLEHLEERWELELSASPDDVTKPIVSASNDLDKVDLFFVRVLVRPSGDELTFDAALERAVSRRGSGTSQVRLPAVDDLLFLKRLAPTPRPNDLEDVRFLEVYRHLKSSEDAG